MQRKQGGIEKGGLPPCRQAGWRSRGDEARVAYGFVRRHFATASTWPPGWRHERVRDSNFMDILVLISLAFWRTFMGHSRIFSLEIAIIFQANQASSKFKHDHRSSTNWQLPPSWLFILLKIGWNGAIFVHHAWLDCWLSAMLGLV